MSRRRRRLLGGGAAALVVVILGAVGVWYFFFRSDAPPPPEIASAAKAAASTTAPTSGTSIDGTWKVDTSIGDFSQNTSTYGGYRIKEELRPVGGNDAVGRSPGVTGQLSLSGKQITAAKVTVDMTRLRSDRVQRDNALHGRGLETDTFPTATFELTDPIQLSSIPKNDTTIEIDATGELTLHGVTKTVTIPLRAQLVGGRTIAVTGSTPIRLSDYAIEKPTNVFVLSVASTGTLEFQVFFTKS